MCGIVGAISKRNVVNVLLEGLARLEYRGYDSAGLAVLDGQGKRQRIRRLGKVAQLQQAIHTLQGNIGIAHTRWATHGKPSEVNAHPHISGNIAVVHNGIIENHQALRQQLLAQGYQFVSETDTEVIAHLIHWQQQQERITLLTAVNRAIQQLHGAYGIVVMDTTQPDQLVAARLGSPLVIGLAEQENFIASDQLALLPVTRRFLFLEEGDLALITSNQVTITNSLGQEVTRRPQHSTADYDAGDKGNYQHYMQKEIFEQPLAVRNALQERLKEQRIELPELGHDGQKILAQINSVKIIACGTSYYAGLVARYWFEALAAIPCDVEIASEYRYRQAAIGPNTLFLTLSQSGETADTLAALRLAQTQHYLTSLTICNVASSSLVRESDFALLTKAGVEIGVASTKAFTTQLVTLLMLITKIGRWRNSLTAKGETQIAKQLQLLPNRIEQVLALHPTIQQVAQQLSKQTSLFFLGRGELYPIALEGALKLKEISYIHAEAYAAGELKHGPLALVDTNMCIVALVANNFLLDKIKANLEEIKARGGKLYLFSEHLASLNAKEPDQLIQLPPLESIVAPILYNIPLQLLAYYVALYKGNDVDKPRNLAKSVTVE